MQNEQRDYITIEDEKGNRKEYAVEALFDMKEESYALLNAEDETIVMKVEGEEGGSVLSGYIRSYGKRSAFGCISACR